MSFVKGLSGFIAGAGAGVIAVAAVSLYVPQFQGSETPTEEATSDVVQPPLESAEQNTAEVTEESEPATTDIEAPKQEVAIVEDAPKIEGDAVDVTKDESKQEEAVESPKQDAAQVETDLPETDANIEEPMSKAEGDTDTPNEVTVEASKSETPKLVLNSELPKAEEKPKKFKLPTIEAEKPADEVLEIVETPKTENEITVGKKPSSKLPKITAAAPETEAEQDDVKFASRALELYATKFEGTDKPLMGVILRDIGNKGLAVDKLKKLNAPITIAILNDAPNASQRALEYHAAGFEVIAMASDHRNNPLNNANNSSQVEDAMNKIFNSVPNAIGLLDSAQAKVQKNGRISKAIVGNFVNTGHGLVTYSKGLNSVDREAQAAGVRTGKISRELDENRENKALIGRYLDRVSLDAGRDGAVIVLGTTSKDTVAALAGWVLSSKGQSVTLAPASAVLLGK